MIIKRERGGFGSNFVNSARHILEQLEVITIPVGRSLQQQTLEKAYSKCASTGKKPGQVISKCSMMNEQRMIKHNIEVSTVQICINQSFFSFFSFLFANALFIIRHLQNGTKKVSFLLGIFRLDLSFIVTEPFLFYYIPTRSFKK